MEKILKQALLYDFYGELLTEHQKSIYEDFVLNDLSLGEIAKEQKISRQGVYDIVKRCNRQLEGYEEKLHLVEKFAGAKEKVERIHYCSREVLAHVNDTPRMIEYIKKIEAISNAIIEDF